MNYLFSCLADEVYACIGKACVGGLAILLALLICLFGGAALIGLAGRVYRKTWHFRHYYILRRTYPTNHLRERYKLLHSKVPAKVKRSFCRYRLRNIKLSKII